MNRRSDLSGGLLLADRARRRMGCARQWEVEQQNQGNRHSFGTKPLVETKTLAVGGSWWFECGCYEHGYGLGCRTIRFADTFTGVTDTAFEMNRIIASGLRI